MDRDHNRRNISILICQDIINYSTYTSSSEKLFSDGSIVSEPMVFESHMAKKHRIKRILKLDVRMIADRATVDWRIPTSAMCFVAKMDRVSVASLVGKMIASRRPCSKIVKVRHKLLLKPHSSDVRVNVCSGCEYDADHNR